MNSSKTPQSLYDQLFPKQIKTPTPNLHSVQLNLRSGKVKIKHHDQEFPALPTPPSLPRPTQKKKSSTQNSSPRSPMRLFTTTTIF